MKSKIKFNPVYWSIFIFIIAQVLTFLVITQETTFLQVNHIYVPPAPPEAVIVLPQPAQPTPPGQTQAPPVGSLAPILIYFAAVTIVLGLVLFLVPVSALKKILRVLFAFLFCWGIFIILVFWLPAIIAIIIAAAVGIIWVIFPRVWLHDSVMILSMAIVGGLGSIAGVILGAVILVLLPEVLREVQLYRMLSMGAGLVLLYSCAQLKRHKT